MEEKKERLNDVDLFIATKQKDHIEEVFGML